MKRSGSFKLHWSGRGRRGQALRGRGVTAGRVHDVLPEDRVWEEDSRYSDNNVSYVWYPAQDTASIDDMGMCRGRRVQNVKDIVIGARCCKGDT